LFNLAVNDDLLSHTNKQINKCYDIIVY